MTINQSQAFNTAQHYLDTRGWLCPQPVIAARQWLQQADVAERLHIVLTDAHGPLDFEVFCARTGHQLLACEQEYESQSPIWHLLIECKPVK